MSFIETLHRYIPNYRDLREEVLTTIIRDLQGELTDRRQRRFDAYYAANEDTFRDQPTIVFEGKEWTNWAYKARQQQEASA